MEYLVLSLEGTICHGHSIPLESSVDMKWYTSKNGERTKGKDRGGEKQRERMEGERGGPGKGERGGEGEGKGREEGEGKGKGGKERGEGEGEGKGGEGKGEEGGEMEVEGGGGWR